MAKSGTINLLPQEEFEASIFGRILRWATGSFRIIVIITEMVVMGAFLSRFWLDAQNADLNDQVKVASAQITAQKDTEDTFRRIQAKLAVFKAISSSPDISTNFDLIASQIPPEVILSTISLDKSGLEVKGTSQSETAIAQFIANLKSQPTFKAVSLENVGSSQTAQGQLDFSLNITI